MEEGRAVVPTAWTGLGVGGRELKVDCNGLK